MSAPHGYGGYSNGCRCEVCRDAKREYERKSRARRAKKIAEGRVAHGKRSTYDAGCRCDECYMARIRAYYTLGSEYQPKKARRPSKRLRSLASDR